jgi:hypothetical protein
VSYRYLTTSIAGFLQQLAVAYVTHGYWFYVTGKIPSGKDPLKIDQKLIRQYGCDLSRWARLRRKRLGLSNVHYLRFEEFFVLIATKGEHPFFASEKPKDIRRDSLVFAGYAIGFKQGSDGKYHASVRLHPRVYLQVRDAFLENACRWSVERCAREFAQLRFEPYAPVRAQILAIFRKVNLKRKEAGLEPVPISSLRLRRGSVRPFETKGEACASLESRARVAA